MEDDSPEEHGQPTVDHIEAFEHRCVIFSDGHCGKITTWVDSRGETFDYPVNDTVAIVAKHPLLTERPWYAAALGADELYREPTNP